MVKVETVHLSKKDYKEKFPYSKGHTSRYSREEATISLPGRGSTGVHLHEIYHAVHSPRMGYEHGTWTLDDFVDEELEATEYSRKAKGRASIPFSTVKSLGLGLLASGISAPRALTALSRGLDKLGYSFPKRQKSDLWWYLKENQ